MVKLSAKTLAELIRGRKVSPVEVVEAYLRQIERVNPKLNAIVTLAPDAIDRAREAEALMMRGETVGPLHGLPVTVKDTIETKGLLTTSGSRLRASYAADEDAPAVARLKEAGAILIGKTNVSEMAIPYECDNPVFGRTNNPHDTSRTSGGSSGGEAATISACLSAAGLGSDLSGSIRVPAHFCGVAGLKPTAGRVSASGHFPEAVGPLSLGAVIGPLARRVEDLSLLLSVLTERYADHTISSQTEARIKMSGWRVASFIADGDAPVTSETKQAVQAALRALSEARLTVIEEKPPGLKRAVKLWPALFSRASLIQLRDVYAGHENQAGRVVRALLNSAEDDSPSLDEFIKAWIERDALRAALVRWMNTTPLIVAPVGSVPAFEHGARRVDVEGEAISVFRAFGYSRIANVLDLPSVSVPAGRTYDGLPIGVQIIGKPFEEEAVLAAASIIEDALGSFVLPANPL